MSALIVLTKKVTVKTQEGFAESTESLKHIIVNS